MFFSVNYQNLIRICVNLLTVLLLFVVSFFTETVAFPKNLFTSIFGGLLLIVFFFSLKQSQWWEDHAFLLLMPFAVILFGLLPGVLIVLVIESFYDFLEKKWLAGHEVKDETNEENVEFRKTLPILITIISWVGTSFFNKLSPYLAAVLFSTITVLLSEYIFEYVGIKKMRKVFISDTYSSYLLATVAMLAGFSGKTIQIYGGIISLSFMGAVYWLIRFSDERLSYPEGKSFLYRLSKSIESNAFEVKGLSKNISSLSLAIGKRLSLKNDELKALELVPYLSVLPWLKFSSFHYRKVGELSIKEKILLGENIKKAAAVARDAGFESLVTEPLLNVYENFDGSGIPQGKKGEEIPLLARIVNVAEAYQTLSAREEEKNKEKITDSVKHIRRLEKKRFDSLVIRELEQILEVKLGDNGDKKTSKDEDVELSERKNETDQTSDEISEMPKKGVEGEDTSLT